MKFSRLAVHSSGTTHPQIQPDFYAWNTPYSVIIEMRNESKETHQVQGVNLTDKGEFIQSPGLIQQDTAFEKLQRIYKALEFAAHDIRMLMDPRAERIAEGILALLPEE